MRGRSLTRAPARGEGGFAARAGPGDEAAVKAGWKEASFNQFVSDMISVERKIKDTRQEGYVFYFLCLRTFCFYSLLVNYDH